MAEDKQYRLGKVASELGVGVGTIVEHLFKKGINVEQGPMVKISGEAYQLLLKDFQSDKKVKEESKSLKIQMKEDKDFATIAKPEEKKHIEYQEETEEKKLLVKDLGFGKKVSVKIEPEIIIEEPVTTPIIKEETTISKFKLEGLKIIDKIDLTPKKSKIETPQIIKEEINTSTPISPEKPIEVSEQVEQLENPKTEPEIVAEIPKTQAIEPEIIVSPEPNLDVEIHEDEVIRANAPKLKGLSVMGKINIPLAIPKKKTLTEEEENQRKKRKRKVKVEKVDTNTPAKNFERRNELLKQSKANAANPTPPTNPAPKPPLSNTPNTGYNNYRNNNNNNTGNTPNNNANNNNNNSKKPFGQNNNQKNQQAPTKSRQKARKERRARFLSGKLEEEEVKKVESRIIKVTEFVTANELATMMNIGVAQIINTCFSLGMMISINQRLDAEIITLLVENFNFEVEFVSADVQNDIEDEGDDPKDLKPRPPIVTVMGHVDHGKTSLLDYIRKANVIAGESGGITQHVAAYEVTLANGKEITFVDTPGHEAFTAMRARGAKITDIVIIVIAADDSVMPQTKEAIAHAQAAGVPIVFAFNKIDKEGANVDRVREQLSGMNILVEEWGGKFQSQEISAKKGLNIDKLLEKVLLEAEILELKANPNKRAKGTVMEAQLDKGRGIVASILVQEGTLNVGDFVLAGSLYGRVKAIMNERDQKIDKAGPSSPVSILGFNGAPTAGEIFVVMDDESSAKEIANRRLQLQREQGIRATKHITLDEIGRRLAIGNFKELKLIVKGDVDGSVEALSDSLLKLSTDEVAINVIHKGVGQITESDVLLASASDAIIVGFQVRPSTSAKKIAESEEIEIKTYSVIYHAIEEIKLAMEGMLAPEFEEKETASIEIRETFKITKIGTIAGCYVLDGKVSRNNKLRIIRDGVVVHEGAIDTLKRFKDDVKDVAKGYECGIQIKNYNDIRVGDLLECYEIVEVKRKL